MVVIQFLVGLGVVVLVCFLIGSMIRAIEECDWGDHAKTWYSTMGTVLWGVVICIVVMLLFVGIATGCIELGKAILGAIFH